MKVVNERNDGKLVSNILPFYQTATCTVQCISSRPFSNEDNAYISELTASNN